MKISKELVKAMRKHLAEENRKYTDSFVDYPKEKWPAPHAGNQCPGAERIRVLRNRNFLVQIFTEGDFTRITVNRTRVQSNGDYEQNISYDDLQWIKSAVGYEHSCAVELFPPAKDLVDVANMRHLWIVPDPPYLWKAKSL